METLFILEDKVIEDKKKQKEDPITKAEIAIIGCINYLIYLQSLVSSTDVILDL